MFRYMSTLQQEERFVMFYVLIFLFSFPLFLTKTSEGVGGFVCLHRNMKTPSCFSKLICPHVNQYDLFSTQGERRQTQLPALLNWPLQIILAEGFDSKRTCSDRNQWCKYEWLSRTSVESKQWRFVSANFGNVIWPIRRVCESLPRDCFDCTHAHSLDTALQLLRLLCCLSAEVSIV